MLRIGKLTDYAFLILETLGGDVHRPLSAQAIAAITHLPEPTVSKVLKILTRGKLVTSMRGAGGGYRIAKRLKDLTVLDVVEVMEGRVTMVECVEAKHTCTIGTLCPAQGRWSHINNAVRDTLSGWSLSDLGQGMQPQQSQLQTQLTGKA